MNHEREVVIRQAIEHLLVTGRSSVRTRAGLVYLARRPKVDGSVDRIEVRVQKISLCNGTVQTVDGLQRIALVEDEIYTLHVELARYHEPRIQRLRRVQHEQAKAATHSIDVEGSVRSERGGSAQT